MSKTQEEQVKMVKVVPINTFVLPKPLYTENEKGEKVPVMAKGKDDVKYHKHEFETILPGIGVEVEVPENFAKELLEKEIVRLPIMSRSDQEFAQEQVRNSEENLKKEREAREQAERDAEAKDAEIEALKKQLEDGSGADLSAKDDEIEALRAELAAAKAAAQEAGKDAKPEPKKTGNSKPPEK